MKHEEEIRYFSKAIPALIGHLSKVKESFVEYIDNTEESLQILYDEIQELKKLTEQKEEK